MSPPATPRPDAVPASNAGSGQQIVDVSASGDGGGVGGDTGPRIVSGGADVAEILPGGDSPAARESLDGSFESEGLVGDGDTLETTEPPAPDVNDEIAPGSPKSPAGAPAPPRRVTTPELKLRRPAPKQTSYHVVVAQRTPSPEPPTPTDSNEVTPVHSDSELDEETPHSPEPAPPKPVDKRLVGKKLRLDVLGARNAPHGFGDIFCLVECGSSFLETTPAAPAPNPQPKQSGATSFEIFFHADGASGDVYVTVMGEGIDSSRSGNEQGVASTSTAPTSNAAAGNSTENQPLIKPPTPVSLAKVTLCVTDLLPDGDLDPAFVDRLSVRNVGDWVPAVRCNTGTPISRKSRVASVFGNATTSVRLVARLVDAGHLEEWEASAQLESAIRKLHTAAQHGDGEQVSTSFETLKVVFLVKTLPKPSLVKAFGGGADGNEWLANNPKSSAAAKAKRCLDVAWSAPLTSDVPRTPLARASSRPTRDGTSVTNELLALGASPRVSFRPGYRTVAGGDLTGENASIEADARRKQSSPAHVAASANSFASLQLMLTADPGVAFLTDGRGYTPLHVAIIARSVESVRALMRQKADPFAKVEVDERNRVDRPILRVTTSLKTSTSPNRPTTLRVTPSLKTSTSQNGAENASPSRQVSCFHSDLRLKPASRVTVDALVLAVRSGDTAIIESVFRVCDTDDEVNSSVISDPGVCDVSRTSVCGTCTLNALEPGRTLSDFVEKPKTTAAASGALFAACRLGNAHAVEKATAIGADLAAIHPVSGMTAMETAASCGSAAVVRILAGASRERKNNSKTRIEKEKSPPVSPRVSPKSKPRPISAMEWAAFSGCDETVRAVLESDVTKSDAWVWAGRVAETRGASLKTKRTLRGRAEGLYNQ